MNKNNNKIKELQFIITTKSKHGRQLVKKKKKIVINF